MIGKILLFIAISYTIPQFSIVKNRVICTFKTKNPSTSSNVYYTPVPDSFPTPIFLEDYMYNEWDIKRVDTIHSFRLRYIRPFKTYLVKVMAVDVKRGRVEVSHPVPLRVVERDGNLKIGLSISGPHIGYREPDTYIIFFETNFDSKAQILYGENGLVEKVIDETRSKRHEIPLQGLKKETRYFYRVLAYTDDDTVKSPLFYFRTEERESTIFAVMGDSRTNYRSPNPEFRINGVNLPIVRKLTWEAFKSGARFIVFVGDLIGGYTEDTTYVKLQYETWWWATWPASAYIPVFGVMGNHDATAPMKRLGKEEYIDPEPPLSAEDFFGRYFVHPTNGPQSRTGPPYKENVYSFSWADAHVVVLNSDYRYGRVGGKYLSKVVDTVQIKWMIEDVKSIKGMKNFLFLHEPPYPVSGHYGSSLDYNEKMRDYLVLTASSLGFRAIFAGHEHLYARVIIDENLLKGIKKPLVELITGRAGAPSYRLGKEIPYMKNLKAFSTDFHYILVKTGSKIVYRAVNLYGKTIDQFIE